MRRPLVAALALVAITAVESFSPLPLAAQRWPDILLITFDTTRADRMGFLGSTRG